MEQKISPSKSALQLGILFGIFMVLEFVVLYVLNIDPISNPTVGVISVVFNLIFPEFINEVIQKMRQVMLKQNPSMTTDQLEMALSMTKKFMSPYIAVPATIVMYSFIGLIYSLIIGAFVKNENPQSY